MTRRAGRPHEPEAIEERQHHHGLAQPHVIGQATAKPELAEKVQPAKALALIGPQAAGESVGRIGGNDAAEPAERFTRAREALVPSRRWLRGEQRIEKSHLAATETEMISAGVAKRGDGPIAHEPVLRQHADRSIPERHVFVASLQRGEQRRQAGLFITKPDRAVQLEPVDARAHLHVERAGDTMTTTICLDVPAFRKQRVNRRGERGLRDIELGPAGVALLCRHRAESGRGEPRAQRPLGIHVTVNDEPPRRIVERGGFGVGVDHNLAVRERERGDRSSRREGCALSNRETRLNHAGDLLIAQLVGPLDTPQSGSQYGLDERRAGTARHRHRPIAAQLGNPREPALIVEARNRRIADDHASSGQQ